jgi:hypothetical protein
MSFQNVRVLYKVLVLVGLLLTATAAVAITGKIGLGHLAHNIERVEQAEKAAIAGSVTAERLLELEVAELVLAANPTPEQVATAEREIGRITGQIEQTLRDLRQSADAEALALLQQAETAIRAYRTGVDETVSRARRLGSGVTLGEAQREILDAALAGRARQGRTRRSARLRRPDIEARARDRRGLERRGRSAHLGDVRRHGNQRARRPWPRLVDRPWPDRPPDRALRHAAARVVGRRHGQPDLRRGPP